MAQDNTHMWEAAREYARNGIYVYPLYVTRNVNGKKDVRPVGRWRDRSSISLADIAAWEQQYPDAGLLIDCGKSGLVVVDCDGPEGVANWLALFGHDSPSMPICIARTPGGEHWFYRAHPDHVIGNDQDGKVAPSVDVRGLGGFVIAAPTSDGMGCWSWSAGPGWDANAVVPDVVIERMTAPVNPRYAQTPGVPYSEPSDDDLFDGAKGERKFTEEQATEWIRKARRKLAATTSGFNGAINEFALACAHFPWLVDRERCARVMISTLGPVTGWGAPDSDDLKTINSAYKATEDGRSWTAVKVAEAPDSRASGQETPPGTSAGQDSEPEDRWTDAMLGGRFAREVLRGTCLYTTALGWLHWTGQVWERVSDEVPHELARRWVLARYSEAVQAYRALPNPDHKLSEDPVVRGWAGAQSANRLACIAKVARGIPEILRSATEFDVDRELLNTPSGVVNLRTGEVSEHAASMLITKMTGVAYRPDADSEALRQALSAVPGDAHQWLRVRLGEAATGVSGEQLVLVTGTGRNGKTLLMGAAFRALGTYAAKVPNTLLLRTRATGGATPERMTLRGVRLAYMEETPEDGYLDANVVKELLDAEEIEGRHLYRDIVTWRPTHSLFLNTNHPPTMGDTGDGAWRRLTRIDFPYRYRKPDEQIEGPQDRWGDPRLKQALGSREGLEALLAWIVAGAREMYAAGSVEESGPQPASVQASMKQWREESDDLLRFIGQEMTFVPGGLVPRSDMYQAFVAWLRMNGHKGVSAKTFGQRMNVHSLLRKRIGLQQVAKTAESLSRPAGLLRDGLVSPLGARVWCYEGLAFINEDQNA